MTYTYLKARAKINLGLDVVKKRADGYHDLRMVMQTVNLFDTIYIKRIDKPTIKVICDLKWLPIDDRNLVYRAAQYMMQNYKLDGGIFIELKKEIPVAAGLAGGSADCAATLVGIRNLFNLPLSDKDLRVIGKTFGADVPYCTMRGTVLAEGIGDRLKKLPPHPPAFVLLAKPSICVSTQSIFKELDLERVTFRPNTEGLVNGIYRRDLNKIASAMGNVLEPITSAKYPIIQDIKKIMKNNGALNAMMSGSGPTVFGIYKERSAMNRAAQQIKSELPELREIFQTTIYNI